MNIAVINSGSSSLKCKVLSMPKGEVLYETLIEHSGFSAESLDIDFTHVDAIGHRVVHGGEKFKEPTVIDEDVINAIKALICLAPLHNRANLDGIIALRNKFPKIPQIAVFDTAFHTTLDEEAYIYALPYELYEKKHIRRYGFHGSSHAYLLKEAANILGKKVGETNIITLHLGNGASACAIKNGRSVDTSMGFTPLEGLVMGSRSGDMDPAIVLYLQRELGYSVDEVDRLLNKESGLMGICGKNDVREILQTDEKYAKLALKMMIRRIQKYIGSYMILLEEVDAIVFSGGIGENSQYIRDAVCDNQIIKNIKTLVIKTDEEFEIANECLKIIKK